LPRSPGKIPGQNSKKIPAVEKSKQPLKIYCALIASEGQEPAHAPQSMQLSASITYTSPAEIASTGHSSMQVPHAVHRSGLIL
jgi:hypothetical protein